MRVACRSFASSLRPVVVAPRAIAVAPLSFITTPRVAVRSFAGPAKAAKPTKGAPPPARIEEEEEAPTKRVSLSAAKSKLTQEINKEVTETKGAVEDDEKLTQTYLEQVKGQLTPKDINGEHVLTWTLGTYKVRVTFPQLSAVDDANEGAPDQSQMEDFESDGEGNPVAREAKDGDSDGESDGEKDAAPRFKAHNFETDIFVEGSSVVTRISSTASPDGQCVMESISFPDLEKEAKFKALMRKGEEPKDGEQDFQGEILSLAELTDELSDSLLAFLEKLRIDDELAQFVQHYVLYTSRKSHNELLTKLKSTLVK